MPQTTILIIGKKNARVVEGLLPHFELLHLEKPDVAALTPEMMEKAQGIANFGSVPGALMDRLPHLQIIANFGVGYDGVDAVHAGRNNILVTNTPDVLTDEVADTTIGLLINTIRRLPCAENWLREGRWERDGAFALSPLSLRGRHVGLYGLGRIGLEIARRLAAFKLAISYHSRNPRPDVAYPYHQTLESLAQQVDTLICIVPKTPDTYKTVNREILRHLGPNGVLINVGRGWSVDEDHLIEALENHGIAAAGLDVFQEEPQVPQRLMALENLCLLPHVGSASVPTRNKMADLVVDNLRQWFEDGKVLTPVAETPAKRFLHKSLTTI